MDHQLQTVLLLKVARCRETLTACDDDRTRKLLKAMVGLAKEALLETINNVSSKLH